MANTVGSITDWMPIVCSDTPPLGFCSSRQAYLYILYSLKPPFELPTYNNRSGVIRECGVELHFEHVNCIPQNEPLASTCRSFTLPSYPDGTSIWYYFSDSCERETATWPSPVFTFSYGTEPSPPRSPPPASSSGASLASTAPGPVSSTSPSWALLPSELSMKPSAPLSPRALPGSLPS